MKFSHSITTLDHAKIYLEGSNRGIPKPWSDLNDIVLHNPKFWEVPACHSHHLYPQHGEDGGLAIHTAQVLMSAWDFMDSLIVEPNGTIAGTTLVTAVIWHDSAKIWEYTKLETAKDGMKYWDKTGYLSQVGHLAGSYGRFVSSVDFMRHRRSIEFDDVMVREIEHIMLSHHGRREWGSPVEPADALAWAVHAADMMSSHFTGGPSAPMSDRPKQ